MSHANGPVDADNHYYEPRDFCTRHIEPRFRERAIRVDEENRIWVGDRPFTFLKNWSFDEYTKPGALRELLRKKRYDDQGDSATTPVLAEYRNRDARLARMDEQGLAAAILFSHYRCLSRTLHARGCGSAVREPSRIQCVA